MHALVHGIRANGKAVLQFAYISYAKTVTRLCLCHETCRCAAYGLTTNHVWTSFFKPLYVLGGRIDSIRVTRYKVINRTTI